MKTYLCSKCSKKLTFLNVITETDNGKEIHFCDKCDKEWIKEKEDTKEKAHKVSEEKKHKEKSPNHHKTCGTETSRRIIKIVSIGGIVLSVLMGVVSFFNNIVATGTFANGDAIGGLGFLAGTILFCYLCILLFRKVGEYRNGARLFLLVIFWLILIFYIGSVLYALLGFFATSPSLLWYVAMIIYSVILGVLIYLFQFNKDIVESYTMETK